MTDTALRLTLDDEAAAYARAQGGVLTIRPSPRHGCCGGRVDLATVDTEAPTEAGAYVQTTRQGVTVHVHRRLVMRADAPMHVGLDRLLGWKALYVDGAAATM